MFTEGPYLFKMEVQVKGRGSHKKNPMKVTAVKVKIKNDRASSKALKVKNIRARLEPQVFQDIETRGYSITPGQWVTKFYQLRKEKQPLLGDQASIEIAFDSFTVFLPSRARNLQGRVT